MDIRHLRLFLKTLEHGNITAAAHDLGITQPALSKQLSRLEEEFGVKLLERLPRGVQPSAFGKILSDHAKSIEASYTSALRHLDNTSASAGAEISIGAGYYWLNGLLPRAVACLVKERPNARIRIIAGVPERLTARLLEGELDLVFAPVAFREGHNDLIVSESLLRTDSVILVRQGHPADDGKTRAIQDLTELGWAMPRGTFIRKRFDQLFEAFGLTAPIPTVEVNDVSAALDVVAHSDLATLASSVTPLGERWTNYGQVACRDLSGWRDSGILRRRHGVVPKLAEKLCDILRDLAKDHVHSIN